MDTNWPGEIANWITQELVSHVATYFALHLLGLRFWVYTPC